MSFYENEVMGSVDNGQDTVGTHDLRGIVCVFLNGQSEQLADPDRDMTEAPLVGLTTSPTVAIVDTAAQDGLIGVEALERLTRQLAVRGLREAWANKKARAHGVGGQTKFWASWRYPWE